MKKELHFIALDIPYPANYGGAIDQYHQLAALAHAGVAVHLHCYRYKQMEQLHLQQICASVTYYDRIQGHKGFSTKLPYIVSSRIKERLINNLLQDELPILLQGIHTTGVALDKRLSSRAFYLRLHNVEHQYYQELAKCTSSFIKKLYYLNEAHLLKKYEATIGSTIKYIFTISATDQQFYQTLYSAEKVSELPVFLPNWELKTTEPMGSYCLYHGDLSVDANEKAAIWLLQKVFNKLKVPLVIAGKDPSPRLNKLAHAQQHTCLVANPGDKEIQDMIGKAHVNILPSFIATGTKIKLLNALFHGKHCVVNEATIIGSGLDAACHVASTPQAFASIIAQLYHQPFTEEEINIRRKLLTDRFRNEVNVQQIISTIWPTKP